MSYRVITSVSFERESLVVRLGHGLRLDAVGDKIGHVYESFYAIVNARLKGGGGGGKGGRRDYDDLADGMI